MARLSWQRNHTMKARLINHQKTNWIGKNPDEPFEKMQNNLKILVNLADHINPKWVSYCQCIRWPGIIKLTTQPQFGLIVKSPETWVMIKKEGEKMIVQCCDFQRCDRISTSGWAWRQPGGISRQPVKSAFSKGTWITHRKDSSAYPLFKPRLQLTAVGCVEVFRYWEL